jgi:quinate dehydrogenase (quinone)
LWKHEFNASAPAWMRCRGLAYFDANAALVQPSVPGSSPVTPVMLADASACQRRIFMNSINARLYSLDADTGELCKDFGEGGTVDLAAALGEAPPPGFQPTSAPTLAGTVVVVGGRIADNVQTDMPGGAIRGFDVITGKLRWAFDPGNPTSQKAPPDGKTYVRSTPNVWAPMSYDERSNTVFLPMGSSSPDMWGGERTALDQRFGASVTAVDGTTGIVKWVFQTVHNDLWDYDVPMQPTLVDFPKPQGATVPAVIFGTKAGQVFVLDRKTGQPLTEVIESPVNAGPLTDETYSPTQPISTGMPQIGTRHLTESDMWGITPIDQLLCRIAFKSTRYEGMFTAPGLDTTLEFPGVVGGMNWGGISVDPINHLIFLNDSRIGFTMKFSKTFGETGAPSNGGEAVTGPPMGSPIKGTPYTLLRERFMSALEVPCQAPPYGTLTAVNLKTREIAWQVPAGTIEDTGPLGLKTHLPIPIGMPTIGGSLSTQGGLLFFAGTQDFYLRAYDISDGSVLWKARLPVGSQGGPMSFISPETGKQYIIVSAGGSRSSPDRGDYVIAYSLPD